jgi:hypothetical protein
LYIIFKSYGNISCSTAVPANEQSGAAVVVVDVLLVEDVVVVVGDVQEPSCVMLPAPPVCVTVPV